MLEEDGGHTLILATLQPGTDQGEKEGDIGEVFQCMLENVRPDVEVTVNMW
jgi:hypothetical protein